MRMIAVGSVASILFSFLLGLILTPTAVLWQEGDPQVVPVPVAAYWFNVAGITVWFTILGVIATCLLTALMMWWMRGKEKV
ncbi:hypothetical protein [Desmospora profundinema]|uniref:Uncharacterized protein n=1 Tax=Desmospora profundinema TaxID=1571184 RepID=A0ABU1ILM6_9BACL|nr:hypothetical protein [Desmospora profundinema]MDR6225318.1 hypothetical protein [Desmospora profundinema]